MTTTPMKSSGRILAAELFGTMVLMLGGPGLAILLPTVLPSFDPGAAAGSIGVVGTANLVRLLIISLGFGFSLLIMVHVIGPVSGCHINPAVTLAMWLTRKVTAAHAMFAVIGQVLGAFLGAVLIYGIASGADGWERDGFAANTWTRGWGLGSTIVVEVLFTAILVVVVLTTTSHNFSPGMNGLVAGLTLALIHMIIIPIDNASVNPVRSLATAVFAEFDTGALEQVWAFIVFPLIGAIVGVVVWLVIDDSELEDTMLAEVPGAIAVRDTLDDINDNAVEAIEDIAD